MLRDDHKSIITEQALVEFRTIQTAAFVFLYSIGINDDVSLEYVGIL